METSEIWIGIIVPIFIGPICAYLMTLRNDYVERKYKRKREKYEEERDSIYNALKNFYWPVYLNLVYIEQYSYQLPIKNKFRYESISSMEKTDLSDDYFDEAVDKAVDKETENPPPKITEVDLDKYNMLENPKEEPREHINTEIISDSSSDNFEISIDIPKDIPINSKRENIVMKIHDSKKTSRRNSKRQSLNKQKTIILDKKTLNVFEENLNQKYSELVSIIEENMVLVCIHQNLNMEIIKFMKYAKVREIIQEGSPDREYNIEYFGVENNLRNLILIIKEILDDLNEKYTQLVNNPI